jgi:L-threonylcarbamoyladenylate synthase
MKRYSQKELPELAEILRHDGVIAVPTDTVYGLCSQIRTQKAQENLRRIKNRPAEKAFPIMCQNKAQMKEVAEMNEIAEAVIDAFMPGPLTVILNKKEDLPDYINGGMKTVALRMAVSPVLEELIRLTGCPLFMTSANQSGEKTAGTIEEIEEACPLLDGILEGDTKYAQASTIIDCTGEIRILRDGPVKIDDIIANVQRGE